MTFKVTELKVTCIGTILRVMRFPVSRLVLYSLQHIITTLSKKRHWCCVAHYNFNPHQPMFVIFGRDVAQRVHSLSHLS